MKRRTFILGASASAVAAGLALQNFTRNRSPETPPSSGIDSPESDKYFDYCVIGSGPAGSIMAQKLVAEGFTVAMLESGSYMSDTRAVKKSLALEAYESIGDIDYPLQSTRVRGVGGTSNIWTGRCPRMLPSDFNENPLAPEGKWPISYEEIKPYYQKAEILLRVSGELPMDGHPPRERALPLPSNKDIRPLQALLQPLNISVNYPPTSSATGGTGPVRFATDFVPTFAHNEKFTLFTDATVTSIESTAAGEIKGVSVRSIGGATKTIQAERYIVACGAVETARLMLMSKSSHNPTGIGNRFDHVGRYFMEHPWVIYTAELPVEPSEIYQQGRTYQYGEQLNREGHGKAVMGFYRYDGKQQLKIALGIEMSPEQSNRIVLSKNKRDGFGNPGAALQLGLSKRDNGLLNKGERLAHEIFASLGSGPVTKQDGFKWSHHHMGTTRMSEDPRKGVVDANLRVHGTSNLYIASSSVFPTSSAVNPTLTIAALSLRLADHLLATQKSS